MSSVSSRVTDSVLAAMTLLERERLCTGLKTYIRDNCLTLDPASVVSVSHIYLVADTAAGETYTSYIKLNNFIVGYMVALGFDSNGVRA